MTNRFKGLDQIDRVSEELWTSKNNVHDTVQEAVIKTIPKKKRCKKAKWLSEEALQITEKRREVKGKGEKERYTNLNALFQRTARRDKKAFHSDQCKEAEENNRMGKTGYHFKNIRDTKGTFHTNMGTIKDRNGMDLTGSSKKQESSRKTSISALLTTQKASTVWITINWKIPKEMGIPDHLTCILRNLYEGQEATELDMEQQTGSK